MGEKIIAIENLHGPFQMIFQRVLRVVPDRDRTDDRLRRLIAFRLKIDGEAETSEFLIRNIRDFVRSHHQGRFYDFLTEGTGIPRVPGGEPEPPGAA